MPLLRGARDLTGDHRRLAWLRDIAEEEDATPQHLINDVDPAAARSSRDEAEGASSLSPAARLLPCRFTAGMLFTRQSEQAGIHPSPPCRPPSTLPGSLPFLPCCHCRQAQAPRKHLAVPYLPAPVMLNSLRGLSCLTRSPKSTSSGMTGSSVVRYLPAWRMTGCRRGQGPGENRPVRFRWHTRPGRSLLTWSQSALGVSRRSQSRATSRAGPLQRLQVGRCPHQGSAQRHLHGPHPGSTLWSSCTQRRPPKRAHLRRRGVPDQCQRVAGRAGLPCHDCK